MRIKQNSIELLNPVLSTTSIPKGSPTSSVSGTFYDLTVNDITLSSAYNNFNVNLASNLEAPYSYENLTPSICDVADWPYVARVAPGLGKVRITVRGFSATQTFNMRDLEGGTTSRVVTGFSSGTVGALGWGILQGMLESGGDDDLFTGGVVSGGGWNFSSASYNPDVWSGDFDFSGVSHHSNETNTPHKPGTLVTSRHAVFVYHYKPPVGTVLTFIGADNSKHQRTVLAYNYGVSSVVGFDSNPMIWDLAVAVLSSSLPSSCKVYPVAGEWLWTETTDINGRYAMANAWVGLKLDQQRRVRICGDCDGYLRPDNRKSGTFEGQALGPHALFHYTDFSDTDLPYFLTSYAARIAQPITGDSGTPRFVPLSSSTMAFCGSVTFVNGWCQFPQKTTLDALIASADAAAGISTGLTVTVAPDPTL